VHQKNAASSHAFTPDKIVSHNVELISHRLPVFANVEAPLELKMRLLIIVNEAGNGIVVATCEHAGRSLLLLDCKMSVMILAWILPDSVQGLHFLVYEGCLSVFGA
jgi:hypothetical protein